MIPDTRLPSSWEECWLGDVVDYGATQKAEPDEIPADAWVLELEDIEKDTSKVLQHVTFAQRRSKSTKNRFATGDVLYGKLRPYLNKVVHADQDGYCTTEIVPLKPSEAIDGGYLFYWLKHPAFLEYVTSVSHGLNMPRLGTEAGKEAPFVLAPLNEQKRIADKLDAVLARVDACRERLDRVPAILKRFRQAVLAAATSGKLTEAWRQAQRLSMESWQQTVFEKVCKEITVGHVGKMADQYRDSGIPFLRSLNVRPFRFDSRELKYISPEFHHSLAKSALRPGDVVVVRTGAPGQCCVIPQELPEANCSDLVIVRPRPELSAAFAAVFINSETSQAFVKAEQVGVAQAHFNVGSMKRAPLLLPSLLEQYEIVRRVEALFAYAGRVEARYTTTRAQVERLTPALLAKAFRGELVPQDPNDEPASVLLERLRATRAVTGEKLPRKVRTERKPMTTKLTTDALKEIIRGLPTDQFTFDDLRRRVSADYETLKDVVFAILSEAPASVKQVFDTEAKTMRLVRVKR